MVAHKGLPVVSEAWISEPASGEIDSVAAWRTDEGHTLVLATAKSGNELRVYDGHSGRYVRSITGGEDTFRRPNGISVVDGFAWVVEREAHRIRVIDLQQNEIVGEIGRAVLRNPYGVWVWPQGDRTYRVFVTDSYYTPDEQVPPDDELGERVKLFDVQIRADGVESRLVSGFGQITGTGVLRTVESIFGDPAHDRLLIADENAIASGIRVYSLDGSYLDKSIAAPAFNHEPEGIALIECAAGEGYWIISDQHASRQVFRVFDRRTLQAIGSFRPARVRMVDGLWFQPGSIGPFPNGALYSQDNDTSVAAFDWNEIASALSLRDDCGQ